MKSRKLKTAAQTTLLLAVVTLMSSCNRGMGCPNNFSIQDVADLIINLF